MINIKINKKDDKPLYVQIRDRLEQTVIQKELNPGDKLPSVTALAIILAFTIALKVCFGNYQ